VTGYTLDSLDAEYRRSPATAYDRLGGRARRCFSEVRVAESRDT